MRQQLVDRHVRLDREVIALVEAAAKFAGITRTDWIRQALRRQARLELAQEPAVAGSRR